MKKPENENYAFQIVKVGKDIPLEGKDRIVHKNIMGNMVITSKDSIEDGKLAIYIPAETQLSEDYCHYNNLYTEKLLNKDVTKKGYISAKNRRIKALSLGDFESNGLLMPLESLNYLSMNVDTLDFKEAQLFDEIDGIKLCNKYVPKANKHSKDTRINRQLYKSKLIDKQFNFHENTPQLRNVLNSFELPDTVTITYKLHGTSGITSRVLEKKPLKWYEEILIKLGVNIVNSWYGSGYFATRNTLKNNKLAPKEFQENTDLYRIKAYELTLPELKYGMTAYYEIVGYTPNGKMIQKGYDYGFLNPLETIADNNAVANDPKHTQDPYQEGVHFGIFIYRLTYTNTKGDVFEFSSKQVTDYCELHGLKTVPKLAVFRIKDYLKINNIEEDKNWRLAFTEQLKKNYWMDQCYMCKSKVPSEGIVIRKEALNLKIAKLKNFKFLGLESDLLDKEIEQLD